MFLAVTLEQTATTAAMAAVAVTFIFRALTIAFNWRTAPVRGAGEDDVTP